MWSKTDERELSAPPSGPLWKRSTKTLHPPVIRRGEEMCRLHCNSVSKSHHLWLSQIDSSRKCPGIFRPQGCREGIRLWVWNLGHCAAYPVNPVDAVVCLSDRVNGMGRMFHWRGRDSWAAPRRVLPDPVDSRGNSSKPCRNRKPGQRVRDEGPPHALVQSRRKSSRATVKSPTLRPMPRMCSSESQVPIPS